MIYIYIYIYNKNTMIANEDKNNKNDDKNKDKNKNSNNNKTRLTDCKYFVKRFCLKSVCRLVLTPVIQPYPYFITEKNFRFFSTVMRTTYETRHTFVFQLQLDSFKSDEPSGLDILSFVDNAVRTLTHSFDRFILFETRHLLILFN